MQIQPHTVPVSLNMPRGRIIPRPPALRLQERKRVHALKRLGIDYTSNEPSLDFITKLVSNVCGVVSAVMTFIDSEHCYIKSSTGIPTDQRCISRTITMCTWVLAPLNPEVLVVEDLSQDERWDQIVL